MRKVLLLFSGIGVLIIISLCGKQNNKESLVVIDIASNITNMQQINISEFSKDIWYVPLGMRPENPLYWYSGLLIDCSDEYILDSDGKTVILYDKAGNFLTLIGNQGRGPGEYSGINYVKLMKEKVFVHDFYSDDLIEYHLDGSLIERYRSGFTAEGNHRLESVLMINDSMMLGWLDNITGNLPHKALIIDKNGNIKYAFRNYINYDLSPGMNFNRSPRDANIFKFSDNIYFKELYNDTLFRLDGQFRLIPVGVFNLGKYREPFSKRGMTWAQKEMSKHIYLTRLYYCGDFMILICDFNEHCPAKRLNPKTIRIQGLKDYIQWYNTDLVLGIYDIRSGNLSFSRPTSTNIYLFTSGFYNDFDAGPRFMPGKMLNDSTFAMKIKFDDLKEYIASSEFKKMTPKFPEKKKSLELLIDSLKDTGFDNPIYMFVRLKEKISSNGD